MNRALVGIVLALVVLSAVPALIPTQAQITWHLKDYQYRRYLIINVTDPSISCTGTNCHARIIVRWGTGTPSNNSVVFLGTRTRPDFFDIKFTDYWGNLLPSWVEEYSSQNYAVIWVKLTNLSIGSGSHLIYMYYGNPYDSVRGNPRDVFIYYDDFSTLSGYVVVQGSWTVSNGWLRSTASNSFIYYPLPNLSRNMLYMKARLQWGTYTWLGFAWGSGGKIYGYGGLDHCASDMARLIKIVDSNVVYIASVSALCSTGSGFFEFWVGQSRLRARIKPPSWDRIVEGGDTTFNTIRGVGFFSGSSGVDVVDWAFVATWIDPGHYAWGQEETKDNPQTPPPIYTPPEPAPPTTTIPLPSGGIYIVPGETCGLALPTDISNNIRTYVLLKRPLIFDKQNATISIYPDLNKMTRYSECYNDTFCGFQAYAIISFTSGVLNVKIYSYNVTNGRWGLYTKYNYTGATHYLIYIKDKLVGTGGVLDRSLAWYLYVKLYTVNGVVWELEQLLWVVPPRKSDLPYPIVVFADKNLTIFACDFIEYTISWGGTPPTYTTAPSLTYSIETGPEPYCPWLGKCPSSNFFLCALWDFARFLCEAFTRTLPEPIVRVLALLGYILSAIGSVLSILFNETFLTIALALLPLALIFYIYHEVIHDGAFGVVSAFVNIFNLLKSFVEYVINIIKAILPF